MSLYNNAPQSSSDNKDYYTVGPKGEQAIDVIKHVLDSSKFINTSSAYLYGNVLKYVIRLGRKGFFFQDIDKCIQYLTWLKEQESDKNNPILEDITIPNQLDVSFMQKKDNTPKYVQLIHVDKPEVSTVPDPLKIIY